MKETLMLGTRKGLIVYRRHFSGWRLHSLHFEGIPVSIAYVDERDGTWWACLDHGHWGCKLHRSLDRGVTWEEFEAPAYPEDAEVKPGDPATTKLLWAMEQGGTQYPDRLWIGTLPGGLFRSDDGGKSFTLVRSLWDHPSRAENWFGGGYDYPGIHSIVVDPRDNDHLYIGISCAGVFESFDSGESWKASNKGLRAEFLPDPEAEVGHDPHRLVAAPSDPDVLWQQNHCGIFVSENGAAQWKDVSQKDAPAYFGFGIAVADDEPGQAWVAPALSDETRVATEGGLCISRSDDGGKSWKAFRKGLPQGFVFDIVYRHALTSSGEGVAFGTTTGNLFFSPDRGERWQEVHHFLPMVYSLDFVD